MSDGRWVWVPEGYAVVKANPSEKMIEAMQIAYMNGLNAIWIAGCNSSELPEVPVKMLPMQQALSVYKDMIDRLTAANAALKNRPDAFNSETSIEDWLEWERNHFDALSNCGDDG